MSYLSKTGVPALDNLTLLERAVLTRVSYSTRFGIIGVEKLVGLPITSEDPKHCYPNSAVLIRPERLDEEILMKDYNDKGNEKDGIVSTPFLEGIGINIVNKVVQVALGT